MRPVENERGRMIETCYLCEREKKEEGDATAIANLRKRDREQEKRDREQERGGVDGAEAGYPEQCQVQNGHGGATAASRRY